MRILAFILAAAVLAAPGDARAGSILDWIREYDLNDYALGVSIGTSQNPYIGGQNSTIAYPYLTSFTHPAFTKDWLLIRDGGLGVRWVTDDWEIGAIGRIQTLGLGNSDAEELVGVADRKWGLEVGPTVGFRRWPVHINLTTYTEIVGRHDGTFSQLTFSYPIQFERGFFIPMLEAIHLSSDYAGYYFEVTPAEATPTRPEYVPGSATNTRARVRLGYALTDKWLLSASLGVQFLDAEITDSPIVDRDEIWSVNVGLAYNADVFNPRDYDGVLRRQSRFDLRVGAFHNNISSKVTRDTADGIPGIEIDVEDILGAPENETVFEVDAIWRIGHFHRFEAGYFELFRDATVTLEEDLSFGDAFFPAGTEVRTQADARVFRLGYAYSLMKDAQKELGVMAGLHISSAETSVLADGISLREQSRAGTPLPVIGVHGSVFLGEKYTLSAEIQMFRMDFDQYDGSLNYASLDLQRRFGETISAGIGYNFYGMKLSSTEDELNGHLEIRHHGPVVFVTAGF